MAVHEGRRLEYSRRLENGRGSTSGIRMHEFKPQMITDSHRWSFREAGVLENPGLFILVVIRTCHRIRLT
jgi:hypothetical protein